MIQASEFCLEGKIFFSVGALNHPTGLHHCGDLALTLKYSIALWNYLIQWKNHEPWLSACVSQELGFGLMPVHFFTSSEIGNFISSREIRKKIKSLSSSLLPIFALLPAVITVYSLSKWKYIFTSTAYCCVCWYRLPEGISGNRAPISIQKHPPSSHQPCPSLALFS